MVGTNVDGMAPDASKSERDATRNTSVGRSRVLVEALALLAVPALLVAVFLLPEATKRAAAFSYADPTLATAVTAHYVHLTVPHLVGNVLGFALLAGTAYGLSVASGRRRLFVVSTLTFLFAFPAALSGLNLAIPRDAIGYGFSGINMAFLGYVAVALPVAVGDRIGLARDRYLPPVFFVSAGYIALIALPAGAASLGFAAASVAVALPYGRHVRRGSLREARRVVARILATPRYGELVAVATVVLVGYPLVGFPAVSPTGIRVNVYIHFLGYALGFLVVYISLFVD